MDSRMYSNDFVTQISFIVYRNSEKHFLSFKHLLNNMIWSDSNEHLSLGKTRNVRMVDMLMSVMIFKLDNSLLH